MLPLVVIIGPTAVGKTKIGVDLALSLNGEIISGDSMQVYHYMDIGTAKIKPEEMKGIPHHLINIKYPDESFSVAEFQSLAENKIKEIVNKGKLPIIVGGTGLYIQAVIDNYIFSKQDNIRNYREEFYILANEKGNQYLHEQLNRIDLASAQKIHVNDLKRIIRALEYYQITGKPLSSKNEALDRTVMVKYNAVLIGLTMERSLLYSRINKRVDKMMEGGLLEETKFLLKRGYNPELPALQGLGYRQIISFIKGEYDLNTAIELIKRATRHFARRQLTWFRRDPRIHWFNLEENNDYSQMLLNIIENLGRIM